MPRRTSNRVITPSSTTYQSPSALTQPLASPLDPNIFHLRRQWKWAAFSQFFFTFNALFAMNEVTLADIENDLAYSTNCVLSRVVQRLLVVLTQDRKINNDNWQNVLRRQYLRRNPDANPIGPLEQTQFCGVESSRASTVGPPHAHGSVDTRSSKDLEDEVQRQDTQQEVHAMNGLSSQIDESVDVHGSLELLKTEYQDPSVDHSQQTGKQINWLDLPMLTKLESLHTLVEWQFQNPLRLRSQMKNDDENAQWRIEPIGYDAKRNAYWLIGADRLWIQREIPRTNIKRKRKSEARASPTKPDKKQQLSGNKRRRFNEESHINEQPLQSTRQKGRSTPTTHPRGSRIAKARANEKLDAQAKDLAEFQRQMATSSRTRASKMTSRSSHRPPSGIRVSARLRGTAVIEDEWQEIPEEWLAADVTDKHALQASESDALADEVRGEKTGLESDNGSISDLTELSDGESEPGVVVRSKEEPDTMDHFDANDDVGNSKPTAEKEEISKVTDSTADRGDSPHVPDEFVEWMTICTTLEEWEDIAKRFENATHYAEKALHKVLAQSIAPIIIAELKEAERKRRMEEAVVHRKRSSRIALKELEKEEERLARKRREEEEEKMSRARRLEARQQKEEAERLKRENAREQRRKERELREQRLAEDKEAELKAEAVAETANEVPGSAHERKVGLHLTSLAVSNGSGSGSRTPAENWELDCEVCLRKGINQDDGVPIMCCGVCSKWQHIPCHDKQDALARRPKRDWDTEEFICRQCQLQNSKTQVNDNATGHHNATNESRATPYAPGTQAYYNYSRNYVNGRYYQAAVLSGRYSYENQSEVRSSPLHPSPYPQQPRSTNVTFAHYQPQAGSFSTSRPTYSIADITQHNQYSHHPLHTAQPTGISPYPPFQSPPTVPLAHCQEQWQHLSYPRNDETHVVSASPVRHTNGVQPYGASHTSNSNTQMQYSQVRDGSQPQNRYSELQHTRPHQPSR